MTSPEQNTFLFVYGSLMSGCERGDFLNRQHKVRFYGSATTSGRLHDLGKFAGLVTDPDGGEVRGELYEVFDAETFFATLDIIEGYWPKQPQRSLFVRTEISVKIEKGSMLAWAYVYNQPVNGFPLIEGGDYRLRPGRGEE